MALANYAELIGAVAQYVGVDSIANVPTFISLFEARANRNLRVPEMEKRATATPTTEYVALPADFLELRSIQINGSSVKLLEYASPQKIDAMGLTGSAYYYSLVGNELQINPSAAGSEVEISYYGKIPALSDANTNFLLTAHPDYYLMGCVYEALLYGLDGRASQVAQIVAEKEAAIIRKGTAKKYGAGPLVVSAV